jgi:hypothetical protein
MDMRDYAGSAFITVEGLREGPRQETIVAVALGKYDKPVTSFESGDQFALNKTNTRTLINAYGEDSRDWIGNTVELFLGTATFNGEERESVVVRPVSPSKLVESRMPAPKSSRPANDMSDNIPF